WGVGTDIFVLDVASGNSENITHGLGDNWLPAWSPDGHSLAFLSDRETDHATLWLWDNVSNVLRRLSDVKIRTDQIVWTPDSRRILVTAFPIRPKAQSQAQSSSSEGNANTGKYSDSTVILYSSFDASSPGKETAISEGWSLDVWLRDLISVNVADG